MISFAFPSVNEGQTAIRLTNAVHSIGELRLKLQQIKRRISRAVGATFALRQEREARATLARVRHARIRVAAPAAAIVVAVALTVSARGRAKKAEGRRGQKQH